MKTTTSGARAPRFFWRGVLILLPLALLAALGVASLRQDRVLAEASARQHGQVLAENAARTISERLDTSHATFSPIVLDATGRLLTVAGSTNRARLADSLTSQPFVLGRLSAAQRLLWQRSREAESQAGRDAGELLEQFIAAAPPPRFLAQAQYDLALLRVRQSMMPTCS